jgi:hypothetical protein
MKQKRKHRIAKYLARQLSNFYPEYRDQFLCPACLTALHVDDSRNFTEAHIVPEAAGGRLTTVLCRSCNSRFGAHQDKWMGELLHVQKSDEPWFMAAKTKRDYFEIDGVRVRGRYGLRGDNQLEFVIREDHLSPAEKASFAQWHERATPDGQWTITLPAPPVFDHLELANIGFLTSGYLLWFCTFGYSWALQEHLDGVRKQIQEQTFGTLPSVAVVEMKGIYRESFLGFGTLASELVLLAGVGSKLSLFPPVDRKDLYSSLPTRMGDLRIDITEFRFQHNHGLERPTGMVWANRLVSAPDVFERGDCPLIYLKSDGNHWLLVPVDSDAPPQLGRHVSVTSNWTRAGKETGRHHRQQ